MKNASRKLTAFALALAVSALASAPASAATTDVRDVDQPARKPYVMSGEMTNESDASGFSLLVGKVPIGNRFVIEFVSGVCSASGTTVPSDLRLGASTAGVRVDHRFAPTVLQDGELAVFTHMTRIYADASSEIHLTIFPTTVLPTIDCSVTLSGHLVSVITTKGG